MKYASAAVFALVPFAAASFAWAGEETLYALSGTTNPILRKLDRATGAILESRPVTGHEALFGGLAADLRGDLYSIDGFNDPLPDRTFRIDPETGAGTVVGETGFNWNFRTLHHDRSADVLYAARDNVLFTIDRGTGVATHVANMTGPGLGQITALAIDSRGNAFITNIAGVDLFTLDLATGETTLLGNLGDQRNWFEDLAFDSRDVLYGSRRNGGVYIIDTGAVTQTLAFSGTYTGLTFMGTTEPPCYADCNGDEQLTLDDFLCFMDEFAAQTSYADCNGDGQLTIDDFLCFMDEFAGGCP